MVFTLPTTRALIDRLQSDPKLQRICGWERATDIPGESTFSRAFVNDRPYGAFAEFAQSRLPARVHGALIARSYGGELVGHISRDSTAIEALEKPIKKVRKTAEEKKPKKRGRPKKGERSKIG